MLFFVLGDERRRLSARTAELEQLTRLLLRAQEDERRRIARELHDEAGQVLTAVKIELDLDGHLDAGKRVGKALAQVRDLGNLLRPSALDDLGWYRRCAPSPPMCRSAAAAGRPRDQLRRENRARSRSGDLPCDARGADQRCAPCECHVDTRQRCHAMTPICLRSRTMAADCRRTGANLGRLGMQERVTAAGGRSSIGGGAGDRG